MSRFGLCGGSYQAESPLADAELAMNLYPEAVESGQGKSALAMYGTPGLTAFCTGLGSVLRGEMQVNGRYFAVCDATLWEVNAAGTKTSRGTVANDNLPVSFAFSQTQILIASAGLCYSFTLATNAFANVNTTGPTGAYNLHSASAPSGLSVLTSTWAVTSGSESGTTATVNLSYQSGSTGYVQAGTVIAVVSGCTPAGYNGTFSASLIRVVIHGPVYHITYTAGPGLGPITVNGTVTIYILQAVLDTNVNPSPAIQVGQAVTVAAATDANYDQTYPGVIVTTQLFDGSGNFNWYVYCTPIASMIGEAASGGGTLTPTGTVQLTANMVGYCDGYFLRVLANSQQWGISSLNDCTAWNPLNTSGVSIFPDNLVSMLVDHREVWLFGQTKSTAYYNTGAASPLFPFSPIQGAYIEQGCAATFSPVRIDNSLMWLGQDDRGWMMAWRANGYNPVRISNHAIENTWNGYGTVSDAIGFSYQEEGHTFYVVSFPTANATWAYDVSTEMWHQRGASADGVTFTAHRAMFHVFCFGKHLVGNLSEGTVYQQSLSLNDDNGSAIYRVRQAPVISNEHEYMLHHRLEILLEPGLATFTGGPAIGESQFTLADANGGLWKVQVLDSGLVQVSAGSGNAHPVYFRDSSGAFWQLGVTTGGVLTTTPVAVQPAVFYEPATSFITTPSSLQSTMSITTGGLMQTTSGVSPNRGAQITVYWSDDFGKTWSNGRVLDCGQTGAYNQRVITRMLGKSRARIYKLVMSDAAPWRIVDAYVEASPGMTPQPRLSERMRQVA